ncbi:TM2 domain-containing protein [Aequorivita sp. CIP111184]|uniref:TM2 domain-containing protein n=1 Tax=Aequorivita sp. CIP111184 TaxID=2211356 RepID=UPI000DBC38D9|nr:TM2 domain-containing protein [Aequorivita sp. CIP111184]SRX52668.1 hypothetical protein AEQU1_00535 [Aequorivita sp. CIP111184]
MEQQNSEYDSTKKRREDATDSFEQQAKHTANEFKEEWNKISHSQENKKILAGVLALVVGYFGIHKFILGYNKEGFLQIVLTFMCGIGAIIALIEGILYLTKSDEEFYQTYQIGKKGWF